MATPVHELDLPEVNVFALERGEAIDAFTHAGKQHWLARMPLGYAVMRHADVVAILRDRRFFSAVGLMTGDGVGGFQSQPSGQQSILSMEGPEHARLRRLVAPSFTPMSADRLRPFMRDVIDRLVDSIEPEGRCEFVADICDPYPIPIICELLGAPKEDWKLFSHWATDIFRIFNEDAMEQQPVIQAAFEELDAYVRALIAERRRQPADDLLSDMIAAEEAGDRLSEAELVMMTEAVLMAGTDTTRNQLACAVALFSEHPDQWALLREQPELAPRAVEESMRYLGAVRGTARIASEDIEYRDVLFPAGSLVVTSLAAANMDETVFADPRGFDITRESSAPQMTFGSGIHHCLGASLARAELQEALPLLARRMPQLEVDGTIEWKPPTVGIWGPSRVPLRFRAA
jgi:cytochrome P450